MPQRRRPRRGSMGYSPRKRAKREVPKLDSWPESAGGPRIQGFAGYKAGMTHAVLIDYRPTSTTAGQEMQIPVTVLETPPLKVVALRIYGAGQSGLKTVGELWTEKPDKEFSRVLTIKHDRNFAAEKEKFGKTEGEEVNIIAHTQPALITGIPKKKPELMEIRIGGGTFQERVAYALSILGKQIGVHDYLKDGDVVDVISVTKGKGFQGAVKRWGVKLLSHKNSKHTRMIGTLGPKRPGYIWPTVPQSGQTGYHQRTELNKRVLKIGNNGDEITPKGGFLNYGKVSGEYLLLHGSVPGPSKRLIRMRDTIRPRLVKVKEAPVLTHISTESKQGV